MIIKTTLALMTAHLSNACGVATKPSTKTTPPKTEQFQKPDLVPSWNDVITGQLTDEGVICQAMRGDDGILYIFENIPEALKTGDKLRVERTLPTIPMPSHCDQGKLVDWTTITRLKNGYTDQVWRKME